MRCCLRILTCCCLLIFGAPKVFGSVDSLLIVLKTQSHNKARLETLFSLTRATIADIDICRKYNDMLLAEAERQQNERYRCEAYLTEIHLCYNIYDTEGVMATQKLLEPIARKEKFHDLLFRGIRCRIDMLALSQNFEQAEREAQKLLKEAQQVNSNIGILEAWQSLAAIYRNTFRTEQAIDLLEKAIGLSIQLDLNSAVLNVSQQLLYLYESANTYEKWIKVLKDLDAYLHRTTPEKILRQEPMMLMLYGGYVKYYTSVENWEQAEHYRLLGESFYDDITSPLYRVYFNDMCADYYSHLEDFEGALKYVRKSCELMRTLATGDNYYNYYNRLRYEAQFLAKIERHPEALELYKQIYAFNDSLRMATINTQYKQLRSDFKADQLILEQGRLRLQRQLYAVVFLIVGFLLVAYFIYHLLHSRRILAESESAMREITRQVEQVNEAKDRFLSNIGNSIRKPLNIVVEGSLRLASHQINDPAEQRRLSEDIRRKSANLLTMINDILDLSRLEAGMMKYSVNDVEIVSLVMNAITSTETLREGCSVLPVLPENRLFMTHADDMRLQQVFTSLVSLPDRGQEAITIEIQEQGATLHIRVIGSLLSTSNPPQAVIIRNEINRMLIEHFGGTYDVQAEQTPPFITLTLPITEVLTL